MSLQTVLCIYSIYMPLIEVCRLVSATIWFICFVEVAKHRSYFLRMQMRHKNWTSQKLQQLTCVQLLPINAAKTAL